MSDKIVSEQEQDDRAALLPGDASASRSGTEALPDSVLAEIHDPYCRKCGSAICEHLERRQHPDADVPDALRRELMQLAMAKQISIYYLSAIYRQGRIDAGIPACEWAYYDDLNHGPQWEGACGAKWEFTTDGPIENKMHFCPECGGRLIGSGNQPTNDHSVSTRRSAAR